MTTPKNETNVLFPSIRLVSLGTGQRLETPLCIPDPPVCIPDPPIPLCPCVVDFKPRCLTVICTCDCAQDCTCDLYFKPPPCHCDPFHTCYCVSKGGSSPTDVLAPESCEAHARTFFCLIADES